MDAGEEDSKTPSPSPDLIPSETERLNLTEKHAFGLVPQTGAHHIDLVVYSPPIRTERISALILT